MKIDKKMLIILSRLEILCMIVPYGAYRYETGHMMQGAYFSLISQWFDNVYLLCIFITEIFAFVCYVLPMPEGIRKFLWILAVLFLYVAYRQDITGFRFSILFKLCFLFEIVKLPFITWEDFYR